MWPVPSSSRQECGRVGSVRLAKRIVAVDAHEGVDLAVDGVDAIEAGLHCLAGGNLLGGELGGEAGEGEFV